MIVQIILRQSLTDEYPFVVLNVRAVHAQVRDTLPALVVRFAQA